MHTLLAQAAPVAAGTSSLATAVTSLYSYAFTIVGLAVFIMFLIAGLAKILPDRFKVGVFRTNPITIITDAIIGLILLFATYLILNTINPNLVSPQRASTVQQ